MRVTLIAAMDENRLIGTGSGGLPWEGLARDKRHFRSYTADKALLLGRRTFEEMTGWFQAGHRPLVVTRDANYRAIGGYPSLPSVGDAVEVARERGEEELVVCGGATVYRLALPLATHLNLTIVARQFPTPSEGGAYFPDWEGEGFEEQRRDWFGADAQNAFGLTFLQLSRNRRGS